MTTPKPPVDVSFPNKEYQSASSRLSLTHDAAETWSSIFDQSAIGITLADLSGRPLRCNQAFADFLGYTADEVLALRVEEITHPDDLVRFRPLFLDLLNGRKRSFALDVRYRGADARYRWAREHISCVDNSDYSARYIIAFVQDISVQKATERKLAAQSEELESVFRAIPDLCFRLDSQGVVLGYYAGSEELLYTSPDNFLGKPLSEVMPPDVAEAFARALPVLRATKKLVTFDYWLDSPTISRCFESRMVPMAGGEIMNVVRDITERRRAESAIQAEKERLNLTLANIADAVISIDLDRCVVLANRAAEELLGVSQAHLLNQHLSDVYITRVENCALPRTVDAILAVADEKPLSRHVLLVSSQGREALIEERVSAIRDHLGNCLGSMIVFRDITEKCRLEEEQLKLEKLQSLSVLAGGIAHDFNNILTGILGNVSLARRVVPAGEIASQRLTDALLAVERAKSLTQQLLTFSKGGSPIKRVVPIDRVIRETADFVLHGSPCSWNLSVASGLLSVEVDEGQMHQVFHNLLLNACQAMNRGGTILVAARNVVLDVSSPVQLPPGPYVEVSIQDSGAGIASENLSKIFDPYFTTKPKGNGLGLASVFSVVRNHGGHIAVQSTLGSGSTFTLFLPATAKSPEPQNPPTISQSQSGKGRILVMDDLESIRDVLSAMLGELGYEVQTSRDGAEMLELYKESFVAGAAFDAVILDLTIPGGMGGKDALAALLLLNPDVRAIVSSGYSNDPILCDYRKYGFVDVIGKPFTVGDVSRAVASVLKR